MRCHEANIVNLRPSSLRPAQIRSPFAQDMARDWSSERSHLRGGSDRNVVDKDSGQLQDLTSVGTAMTRIEVDVFPTLRSVRGEDNNCTGEQFDWNVRAFSPYFLFLSLYIVGLFGISISTLLLLYYFYHSLNRLT